MTKTEQLTAVAERLNEEQIDALLDIAQSMAEQPFYNVAPPEALASIKQGLEQLDRGEGIGQVDVVARLKAAAAKPRGT